MMSTFVPGSAPTAHDTAGTPSAPAGQAAPIAGFSRCHEGIFQHLQSLQGLPQLLEQASRLRALAAEMQRFFRSVVYEHHQQEERELFPAVLASATAGSERDEVRAIAERLTTEHREVEAAFEDMEPALKKVAKGHEPGIAAEVLGTQVARLVRLYEAHAGYEEVEFLPLAERILGRHDLDMAALGLSLHLRHAYPEVMKRFGSRI